MKKFIRTVIGITLTLMLICSSSMSVRAAMIDNLSGIVFISGSSEMLDQYVNNIASKHIATLAQLGSIDVCAEYSVSSGIQQFTFSDKHLVPNNIYYYLVYGDDKIVGVITAHQYDNGDIVTGLITGYTDVLNDELVDSVEKYMFVSTGSALYLVKGNKNTYLLEHLIEYEEISDMQNIGYGDYEFKEIENTINKIDVACIPATQASINLNVPIVKQYGNPICWAASMASILNHVSGTSYTARDVADATGKGLNGATYNEVNSYYTGTYNMSVTGAGTMTSSKVAECLNNGQPIQVFHFPSSGSGHSLVLTGMVQVSSDLFYVYMDPNYSSYRSIEVITAAKTDGTKVGIEVGGTTMYWSNSIYDIH